MGLHLNPENFKQKCKVQWYFPWNLLDNFSSNPAVFLKDEEKFHRWMPRHSIFSKVWISSSLNQRVRVFVSWGIFLHNTKTQTFLGEMIDLKKIHMFRIVTKVKSPRSCMFTCVGDHAFPLVKAKKLLPDWNFEICRMQQIGKKMEEEMNSANKERSESLKLDWDFEIGLEKMLDLETSSQKSPKMCSSAPNHPLCGKKNEEIQIFFQSLDAKHPSFLRNMFFRVFPNKYPFQ